MLDGLFWNSKVTLEKLRGNDPDRIVTLEGDCSVSVIPFTYLAEKYSGDVAVVWIDTHPDGMKIQEVVRVINDIAAEYDLVGLTVAEPMPRIAVKIRNMLDQLPLLKD